ncbi:MAG: DEAD/DEAH box helicase, partial [Actinobacteria bacterium]|nr:DEAD/DEAH box helicase [Actinomycetota bacterium]
MRALVQMLGADTAVASCIGDAQKIISPAPTYPFLLALRAQSKPLLVITSSSRAAEDLANELRELHPNVLEFPAWETLPHERLSPRSDTVARRLATLSTLARKDLENPIVVAPIRAAIHRFIADLATAPLQTLEIGGEVDLTSLVEHLTQLAYTRTDLVEKRGEFAVRGGIVDLFLPLSEHPIRIDFFGDEIEELSFFEVSSQRTTNPVVGKLAILPCRELLLSEEIRSRAESVKDKYPAALEILDRMAQGIISEGMESLIPILIKETETIFQRVSTGSEVVFIDDERIRMRTMDLLATNDEFFEAAWSHAALGAVAPLPVTDATYLSWDSLNEEIVRCGLKPRAFNPFGTDLDTDATFLDFSAIDPLRGDADRAVAAMQEAVSQGFSIIFSTAGQGMAERYAGIFRDADLPVFIAPELKAIPTKATIHITQSSIAHGFSSLESRILFMTERDLTGSKASAKDGVRMPSKRKQAVDPLELRAGDFVVHEQHGIGRYVEMVQRTINGVTREYLVIEYAPAKRGQPGDRIFVPTDTLEQVSKYVGGEAPAVHRIGSGEWQKAKGRARKAVKQIAGELIRLYAARTSSPGYAFSADTPWQRELEDAFSYIETPDQLSTIEEVKRDMEKPYPMDRIICGDVGYGKTEIAIRAAFKAVQDGKQVAVLVPTTLLVQQHAKTFAERYSGFPIRVAGMSRFNTAKESKEILAELAAGSVDVVIGTHRLLSQDVIFKDLGLVIVDEEQRFGVEQKESLKKMRTTVDVLAMSATPIP